LCGGFVLGVGAPRGPPPPPPPPQTGRDGYTSGMPYDDDDWVGTPPEGHHSRSQADPGFWRNQPAAAAAGAILFVLVLVLVLIILLS
jgi:hypothetical protein